jgi:hypothetical protein
MGSLANELESKIMKRRIMSDEQHCLNARYYCVDYIEDGGRRSIVNTRFFSPSNVVFKGGACEFPGVFGARGRYNGEVRPQSLFRHVDAHQRAIETTAFCQRVFFGPIRFGIAA